jgi:hypothetical protein
MVEDLFTNQLCCVSSMGDELMCRKASRCTFTDEMALRVDQMVHLLLSLPLDI